MPARVLCGRRAFETMTVALFEPMSSAGRVFFCRGDFPAGTWVFDVCSELSGLGHTLATYHLFTLTVKMDVGDHVPTARICFSDLITASPTTESFVFSLEILTLAGLLSIALLPYHSHAISPHLGMSLRAQHQFHMAEYVSYARFLLIDL